jgi:hypothetical protein
VHRTLLAENNFAQGVSACEPLNSWHHEAAFDDVRL